MWSRVGLLRGIRRLSTAASLAGLATSFALLTATSSAEACSIAPPPLALVGSPRDGDTDVPVDVVPFYDTLRARLPEPVSAAFELTDADGTAIPFSLSTDLQWHVQLVPTELLAPNTEHVLRVLSGDGEQLELRFTTGQRAAAYPDPPTAAITHYKLDQSELSSCSPPRASSCIWFDEARPIVMQTFGYSYLLTEPVFHNLSGIEQGTPDDCVLLFERAEDGELSEPVKLCREDGPVRVLVGSEDLTCDRSGFTQVGGEEPVGGDGPSGAGATGGVTGTGGAAGEGSTVQAGDKGVDAPVGDDPSRGGSKAAADVKTSSGCGVSAPVAPRSTSWCIALALTAFLLRRRSTPLL